MLGGTLTEKDKPIQVERGVNYNGMRPKMFCGVIKKFRIMHCSVYVLIAFCLVWFFDDLDNFDNLVCPT